MLSLNPYVSLVHPWASKGDMLFLCLLQESLNFSNCLWTFLAYAVAFWCAFCTLPGSFNPRRQCGKTEAYWRVAENWLSVPENGGTNFVNVCLSLASEKQTVSVWLDEFESYLPQLILQKSCWEGGLCSQNGLASVSLHLQNASWLKLILPHSRGATPLSSNHKYFCSWT